MLMTTVTTSGMTLPFTDREVHCSTDIANESKRAQAAEHDLANNIACNVITHMDSACI